MTALNNENEVSGAFQDSLGSGIEANLAVKRLHEVHNFPASEMIADVGFTMTQGSHMTPVLVYIVIGIMLAIAYTGIVLVMDTRPSYQTIGYSLVIVYIASICVVSSQSLAPYLGIHTVASESAL